MEEDGVGDDSRIGVKSCNVRHTCQPWERNRQHVWQTIRPSCKFNNIHILATRDGTAAMSRFLTSIKIDVTQMPAVAKAPAFLEKDLCYNPRQNGHQRLTSNKVVLVHWCKCSWT